MTQVLPQVEVTKCSDGVIRVLEEFVREENPSGRSPRMRCPFCGYVVGYGTCANPGSAKGLAVFYAHQLDGDGATMPSANASRREQRILLDVSVGALCKGTRSVVNLHRNMEIARKAFDLEMDQLARELEEML